MMKIMEDHNSYKKVFNLKNKKDQKEDKFK